MDFKMTINNSKKLVNKPFIRSNKKCCKITTYVKNIAIAN